MIKKKFEAICVLVALFVAPAIYILDSIGSGSVSESSVPSSVPCNPKGVQLGNVAEHSGQFDEDDQLANPPGHVDPTAAADLFRAIRMVESDDNIHAVGLNGELGAYQISKDYWTDGCEYALVTWDYIPSVWVNYRCEQVMLGYWKRYGAITDEQKARMHNGGPRGMEKEVTKQYWNKVKEQME